MMLLTNLLTWAPKRLWAETALVALRRAQTSAWQPTALPSGPANTSAQQEPESQPVLICHQDSRNLRAGLSLSLCCLSGSQATALTSTSLPREANCLWRAKRDCTLVFSSFMVVSMWLALREWSVITVCCGGQRVAHMLVAPHPFLQAPLSPRTCLPVATWTTHVLRCLLGTAGVPYCDRPEAESQQERYKVLRS